MDMELEEFIGLVFINLNWISTVMYVAICCCILWIVKRRFMIVNRISKMSLSTAEVSTFAKLHLMMSELLTRNSRNCVAQFAMLCAVCLMNTVFGFVELFISIKEQNRGMNFALALIGNLTLSVMICSIIGICSVTTSEREMALRTVHKNVYEGGGLRKLKRVQLALLQMQHNNAKISCGLFEIDWKLMMMVNFLQF